VGNHVTQAGDFPLGNLWMFLPEIARYLSCRFPDHFQAAYNCQKRATVFFQVIRIVHPTREIENILAGLQNVIHV
jgi:hypothetical protein